MVQLLKRLAKEKNMQSLFTSVFIAAINLVTFILLVRTFSKNDFGEYVIFITAASLADLIRYGLTKRALTHYISAGEEKQKDQFMSSGIVIDIFLGISFALIIYILYLIFPTDFWGSYQYFFIFYPLLSLANIPWNNAASVQQAEQRFDRILIFRLLINVPFFGFVVLNKIYFGFGPAETIMAFIVANSLASGYATFKKWNGWHKRKTANKKTIKKIIKYGKYTVLTSAGSSLLRSADALIIGLSPILGATGVAIYSIPFKIIDLIQIPLNAFVATASPKLSKSYIKKQYLSFTNILVTYTSAVSYLFVPVVLLSVVFSKPILMFFAGDGYNDAMPVMTSILYLILLYGLLLPFDRFTGVALDSAEMPSKNALKTNIMLFLNLAGNLIAVFVFQSLVWVAAVSVVFTITGMALGWYYLKRKFDINFIRIFTEGYSFYKSLLGNALHTFQSKTK